MASAEAHNLCRDPGHGLRPSRLNGASLRCKHNAIADRRVPGQPGNFHHHAGDGGDPALQRQAACVDDGGRRSLQPFAEGWASFFT